MALLARFALFSLLLPCVVHGRAENFKVGIPPYWQERSEEAQLYSILENTKNQSQRETIVTQKFARSSKDDVFQANLEGHQAEIAKLRARFFQNMGLGNYTILEIRKRQTAKPDFAFYQEIHSRYLSFDGHETQTLERQYAGRDSLFVVTYILRDSALNDRPRANRLLDLVKPVEGKRHPASEIVTSNSASKPAVGEVSDVPPTREPRALDMKSAEAKALCETVPENIRRKPGEGPGFDSLSEQFYKVRGCATGVVQSLWGMITGAVSALGWFDKLTSIGESEARDQLYAAAGAVAKEIKQDGVKNFAWRIGMGVYEAAAKEINDFPCLSNEEQMRKVCAILGNAIPPGILIKLATRTVLTAKETAELVAAIRKGSPPPGAQMTKAVPSESDQLKRFAEGTLTREQALAEASAAPPAQRSEAIKSAQDAFAKYENIKALYGDLLPANGVDHAKIFELIAKAEARGVKKTKIRDTLRIEGARCTR